MKQSLPRLSPAPPGPGRSGRRHRPRCPLVFPFPERRLGRLVFPFPERRSGRQLVAARDVRSFGLTFQRMFAKIVMLGGSGLVGSAICKAAVSKGIEVVSFSSRIGLGAVLSGAWHISDGMLQAAAEWEQVVNCVQEGAFC